MASSFFFALLLLICVPFSKSEYSNATMYNDPDSEFIVSLNESSFDSLVKEKDDLWLVEFYAPWCGHCRKFLKKYQNISKILKGVANVGAVDTTKFPKLTELYGVKGTPEFFLFYSKTEQPFRFYADHEVKDMIKFVTEAIKYKMDKQSNTQFPSLKKKLKVPSASVEVESNTTNAFIEISDVTNLEFKVQNSKEVWLLLFNVPCGPVCDSIEYDFTVAAEMLKGKIKTAVVDVNVGKDILKKYPLKSYPVVKAYLPSKGLTDMTEYNGTQSPGEYYKFALSFQKEKPREVKTIQIVSEEAFDKNCPKDKGFCIILFTSPDSQQKNKLQQLRDLSKVGEMHLFDNFTFFWTGAGEQPELENAFEVEGQYPAGVAISHDRKKFAFMKEEYAVESLEIFLSSLKNEKLTHELKQMPKLKTVKPWTGKL